MDIGPNLWKDELRSTMASIPDVVGNSLTRARERMTRAGISISCVDTLDVPTDWKPRAHNASFKIEPYVVVQSPADDGLSVDLTVVNAWLPPEA